MLAWLEHGVLKQLRGEGEASRELAESLSGPVVPENGLIPVALPNRESVRPYIEAADALLLR